MPSTNYAPIWKYNNGKPQSSNGVKLGVDDSYFHLHIVSDEEIQVGDYYTIYDSKSVHKAGGMNQTWYKEMCKKIIASTDSSLNLPKLSNDFIKKYCEVGGIDEIMIEYETGYTQQQYSEIDLQFERPKVNSNNEISISRIKEFWTRDEIKQLLWQAFTAKMDKATPIVIQGEIIPEFEKWLLENL